MSKSGLSERVTEDELAKRATAERVTLEQVEGSIDGEWYFTGSEGAKAAGESDAPEDLERVTICMLRLFNGFIILGHSAPASAANFDAEIGKRLARERAIMQIWQLLGFDLKTRQWMTSEMTSEKGRNQEGNSTSESPATNTSKGLASPGSEPKKTTAEIQGHLGNRPGGKLGAED